MFHRIQHDERTAAKVNVSTVAYALGKNVKRLVEPRLALRCARRLTEGREGLPRTLETR